MADLPIAVSDAVVTLAATANGQAAFAFDFPIYDETHLQVHLDDVLLVLDTQYTVAGIEDAGGGTVTLVAATAAGVLIGDTVKILRSVPIERIADYQTAGDFRAETINRELDLMTMWSQELRRDIDLAVIDLAAQAAADVDHEDRLDALEMVAIGAGNFVVASELEATTGTDNTKGMTPLRTAQAIEAAEGVTQFASRAIMAAADPALGAGFLKEVGREGLYQVVEYASYSGHVTDANGLGLYIRSTNDTSKVWAQPKHKEIVLTDLGADPTDTSYSDEAMAAALAISKRLSYLPIFIPPGWYRLQGSYTGLGPHPIKGADQSTAGGSPRRGVRITHYSNGNLFSFNGGDVDAAGTGGCIENLWAQKATGFSGGVAVHLLAQSDARRPGEFEFRNFLTGSDGNGAGWLKGIEVDGRLANTPGGRGVRTVTLENIRLTGCMAPNEYASFRQVTHLKGHIICEEAGTGMGAAGITFNDFWENVDLGVRQANVIVNHTGIVGADTVSMNLRGFIPTLDINFAGVKGAFIGDSAAITSNADLFKIISMGADFVSAFMTTTVPNASGDGTEQIVVWDTPYEDRNGNYNPANARYTAKCRGKHNFEGGVTFTGLLNTHTRYDIYLRTYSSAGAARQVRSMVGNAWGQAISTGFLTIPFGFKGVSMDEGDYALLSVKVTGGAKVVGVLGSSADWLSHFAAGLSS